MAGAVVAEAPNRVDLAAPRAADYAPRVATISDMADKLRDKQGWVPGKRIKLDFGPDGLVLLDGVTGTVSQVDGSADTTIAVTWADLQALGRGEIDPVTALMKGRLRIDGDMANALQLQSVIEKLQSD